jgi:SMP-30/Gluconolactonase/LRE-like region
MIPHLASTISCRALAAGLLALAGLATLAAPATAAPPCAGSPPQVNTLLAGQGVLESVIVSDDGRLFFTANDALMRLDRPGGEPRLLTPVIEPGGLAFDRDGSLIVGFGNSIANGTIGDTNPQAGLLRVDPDTGASEVYATGLSMANGVTSAPDGSFYATNDFGANVDRVRNGQTEHGFAKVQSGNGIVVDSSGRYLYVAQTLVDAAIQRVEIAAPQNVTPYVVAEPADRAAGLDGMAIDARDRLFVAANLGGQIWRVAGSPPAICVLVDGLAPFPDGPSAVATGSSRGPFPAENLYAVSFNGLLLELVDVAKAPKPSPIRLTVRPRRTRAGVATRFRFRATTGPTADRPAGRVRARQALEQVRIRFAGERARTNRRGRATIEATFAEPGRYRARAKLEGYRSDRATVRVRPRG